MDRRSFLTIGFKGMGALLFLPIAPLKGWAAEVSAAVLSITKITKSDDAWKKQLSDKAYDVLRHEGTERPFSSPLNHEKRAGTFLCAGCDLPLFPSSFKFDSGTGWPSFFDVIPGRIETKTDTSLFMTRREYHCAQCGGHQGHIFEDGPKPTGLRYCNNGVALNFVAKEN